MGKYNIRISFFSALTIEVDAVNDEEAMNKAFDEVKHQLAEVNVEEDQCCFEIQ